MKNKAEILKFVKRYAAIIFGCVVFALGVTLFLDANNIASGGVTGIAIILNFVTKDVPWLNTGIWIIIINVPLFILGWIFFGHRFILSTVFSTVLSSLLVWVFEIAFKSFLPITENVLISSVLGGALFGGGLGLIFRMGSTTGGTDIVVKILRKKFRHIRTGIISMIIDMIIVWFSAIVYRDFELVCYTVVSIVVVTIAFDWVLYGGNSAKLVHIITTEEFSSLMFERILKELDITATYVDGKGAYSGNEKRIIFCAVRNTAFPKLRDIIKDIDPTAFTIVSSAKEIYGEGYIDHNDEEL